MGAAARCAAAGRSAAAAAVIAIHACPAAGVRVACISTRRAAGIRVPRVAAAKTAARASAAAVVRRRRGAMRRRRRAVLLRRRAAAPSTAVVMLSQSDAGNRQQHRHRERNLQRIFRCPIQIHRKPPSFRVPISGQAWAGCIAPYFALREKEGKTVMSAGCSGIVLGCMEITLQPQECRPPNRCSSGNSAWHGRIVPPVQQSQSHPLPLRRKSNVLFRHETKPVTVFAPILRIAY